MDNDKIDNKVGAGVKEEKTSEENAKLCDGCSKCCEYVTVAMPAPKNKYDLDEVRWWLLHGVYVFIDDDGWNVWVPNKCHELDSKGMCKIYDNRPLICRGHFQDQCERYHPESWCKVQFTNPEDFLKYVDETPELKELWDKEE